jgi:hypothetical protein
MAMILSALLLLPTTGPDYPPLPEAVSSLGAAVCDGYVYVYGGHAGKTHAYSSETTSGKFRRLSLTNPAAGWEELPGGTKAQGLSLIARGGKLYRLGGMEPRNAAGAPADHYSLTECAVYDPKTRAWSPLPSFPDGRSSHDAVLVGDTLVVVGGWKMQGRGGKSAWHDTALVMNLFQPSPKWESIPQPFRRRAQQLAVKDGRVYCLGGLTPDGEMDKSVEVFDLARREWSSAPALPGQMMNGFTPGVAVSGGELYASPADGYLYRLGKDSWEEVGVLRTKRFVHRLVALPGGSFLAIGGASKGGNVAEVERVVLRENASVPVEKTSMGKQAYCPVMTTIPVDDDSPTVEWQGITIRLCCKSCLKKWTADPNAYLRPELLPQLAGANLPSRELQQVFCPVYKDRVVSSRDPSIDYRGVRVYVFNQSAKQKFETDPEKHADPKLLPQLRTAK